MFGPFSIESSVRLLSREIDEKLKSANILVTELMNLASGHGDQKLQSIQLVVNEAVKLASKEMDEKMKVANLIATDAMLLGASELEKKINSVHSVVDLQRKKVLSSAVALVYFTLLLSYALYSRSSLMETHDIFLALQFAILGFWIADLIGGVDLRFLEGVNNRDGFFVLTLMVAFLSFVYFRGVKEKEGKRLTSAKRRPTEVME